MNKGIFWFLCFVDKDGDLAFTGEILTLLISCDEEGNPKAAPSYNSKNGRSNTHKDSWIAVTAGRKDLRGISWNYYPRGRVEISRGRALVFMNPLILNCEDCLELIREAFRIGDMDIRVKIDNSAHYQCGISDEISDASY